MSILLASAGSKRQATAPIAGLRGICRVIRVRRCAGGVAASQCFDSAMTTYGEGPRPGDEPLLIGGRIGRSLSCTGVAGDPSVPPGSPRLRDARPRSRAGDARRSHRRGTGRKGGASRAPYAKPGRERSSSGFASSWWSSPPASIRSSAASTAAAVSRSAPGTATSPATAHRWSLAGLYSAKGYKLLEAVGASPGHLSGHLDFYGTALWRDATQVAYHGLGSTAPPTSTPRFACSRRSSAATRRCGCTGGCGSRPRRSTRTTR